MPKHSKKPSVRVELRACGDPHRSEKPGWSAGDMRQWPKKRNQKMHSHPVSPTGVLLLPSKEQPSKKQPSSKITTKSDLFKVSKITNNQLFNKLPSKKQKYKKNQKIIIKNYMKNLL